MKDQGTQYPYQYPRIISISATISKMIGLRNNVRYLWRNTATFIKPYLTSGQALSQLMADKPLDDKEPVTIGLAKSCVHIDAEVYISYSNQLVLRHMRLMAYRITGNSSAFSTACSIQVNIKENITTSHHWPFVSEIHVLLGDSPYKGPGWGKRFHFMIHRAL